MDHCFEVVHLLLFVQFVATPSNLVQFLVTDEPSCYIWLFSTLFYACFNGKYRRYWIL